jgi:UDP-N-acetylmuramate dehydrogenase
MMAAAAISHLADALPPLAGRIQAEARLAPVTWFRVGGPAEVLVRPASVSDLASFLAALPLHLPLTVIGAASNLIVRDGGIAGVTLRLARGFGDVAVDGNGVIAGAAALDANVAEHAAQAGLSGLEFLSGIPGAIGGAVAMNAGAYGGDVAGTLDWADILTRQGEPVRLSAAEIGFSYRHSGLPAGSVVVRARFHARPGDHAVIAARMADIRASREATQPVRARTGGSTFRNPPGARAWELIDAAGCRGLTRGAAQVSEKHCNFLLNTGHATASDLEGLGEEVRRRVQAVSGITLDWEIKRIGVPGTKPEVVA